VAGLDPAAFLAEHAEQVGYVHLKDYERDPGKVGRDGLTWRELGNGVVDWDGVMEVLPKLDRVEWALVEQDRTDREPGESLRISRAFLQARYNY
jgi:sugar phosphate isomerase/epimerase